MNVIFMQGRAFQKNGNSELLSLFSINHHSEIHITIMFDKIFPMVKKLRSKLEVCAICNAEFIKGP